jgi:KaiC/GvpD/RAD55 family RecA-like ATPase
MIPLIRSGITGLDELIGGGFPNNTMTLIYGPPKTGKSIFCYHFLNQTIADDEFSLYVMTDYNLQQLEETMMCFNWFIHDFIQKKMLYVMDIASGSVGAVQKETAIFKISSPQNPTEIISKVIEELYYEDQAGRRYRHNHLYRRSGGLTDRDNVKSCS